MKERTWLSILLSYAGPCRGKMAASVALAVVSVAGGFVPYLGVYQILRLFVERRAGLEGILLWCGVCLPAPLTAHSCRPAALLRECMHSSCC